MNIALFYHSLLSDWNHGNAHFLRGVVGELKGRGHDVTVYEPRNNWSLQNLRKEYGEAPVEDFYEVYPGLGSIPYDMDSLDLDKALQDAELVIVHEWNEPQLIRRIGEHRQSAHYRLLFHDTHHRSLSDSAGIAGFELEPFDGVLAFGEVIRQRYLEQGWANQVWTWHEAADTRLFHPHPEIERTGDLVWIGNWGDDERSERLEEFLFQPIEELQLRAEIYGVRYPDYALERLAAAQIPYRGWLPNFAVPEVFARFKSTVHIPRQPYVEMLPGIPTIRVFEALACGIPLICSPWDDAENLFTPGEDYLIAEDGAEMQRHLCMLLNDSDAAASLAEHGLETIRERHTCAHRVDQLLGICAELGIPAAKSAPTAAA